MLVTALLNRIRERLDDPLPDADHLIEGEDADIDCRWKTTELLGYLTDAEREACIRARLIRDSETADICVFDIGVGDNSYPLDSRVLAVLRLVVPGITRPLSRVTFDELDRVSPGWQEQTGEPSQYCLDLDANTIYLDRLPLDAYAGATLTVNRLPLADLALYDAGPPEVDAVELEIPEQYHVDLIDWVERCAYLKRDTETYDKVRADAAELRFIRTFGDHPKAADMKMLRTGARRRSRGHFL